MTYYVSSGTLNLTQSLTHSFVFWANHQWRLTSLCVQLSLNDCSRSLSFCCLLLSRRLIKLIDRHTSELHDNVHFLWQIYRPGETKLIIKHMGSLCGTHSRPAVHHNWRAGRRRLYETIFCLERIRGQKHGRLNVVDCQQIDNIRLGTLQLLLPLQQRLPLTTKPRLIY